MEGKAEYFAPSALAISAMAFGWGATVFVICLGVQWLFYDKLLNDPGGMRLVSPIVAAVVTAVFDFRLQMRNRRNGMSQLRRLHIIREMNHHIRNAMQIISCQTYTDNREAHATIEGAMHRIDWALRDLLPHVISDADEKLSRSNVVGGNTN